MGRKSVWLEGKEEKKLVGFGFFLFELTKTSSFQIGEKMIVKMRLDILDKITSFNLNKIGCFFLALPLLPTYITLLFLFSSLLFTQLVQEVIFFFFFFFSFASFNVSLVFLFIYLFLRKYFFILELLVPFFLRIIHSYTNF